MEAIGCYVDMMKKKKILNSVYCGRGIQSRSFSSKSWQSEYSLCEVVGVTDIVVRDNFYPEAVNIVIKPKEV